MVDKHILFIVHLLLLLMIRATLHSQLNYNEQNVPDYVLPSLFKSESGKTVTNASDWTDWRKEELKKIFQNEVYGYFDDSQLTVHFEEGQIIPDFLNGKATLKEVNLIFSNNTLSHKSTMLLIIPNNEGGAAPIFAGLNFYGNQTIHPERRISISDAWVANNADFGITDHQANDQSRGVRGHRWPVEELVNQGFGLATMYYGDLDPDFDDGFQNGLHQLIYKNDQKTPPEASAISAWAFGLSKMMDYFENDPTVDRQKVAVLGHSRLGKAALWAGAIDDRFWMVISNNSGCGGAALSKRKYGETVAAINTRFPHWFSKNFHKYNNNEDALPVDQHMLIALCAPRPVYVASASEDRWADPKGEFLSLITASQVYSLFNAPEIENQNMPITDNPLHVGKLGYHIRSGKHDLTLYDWKQYMHFAKMQYK